MSQQEVSEDDAEGGPRDEEPGEEGGAEGGAWLQGLDIWRNLVFPGLTLLFLVVVLVSFHKILLPFVFACAIVYLMEPIVQRLSRSPEDPSGLPRWITVILVYLVFFTTVTVSAILIVPRLVSEVQRLGNTLPESVQTFREESLPGLNERVQSYLKTFNSKERGDTEAATAASRKVQRARRQAADTARALGAARARVERASNLEQTWKINPDTGVSRKTFEPVRSTVAPAPNRRGPQRRWGTEDTRGPPAFRIVPGSDGMEVYLNGEGVEISEVSEKTWAIRPPGGEGAEAQGGREKGLHTMFDLEERLDEVLQEAITFSNEQLTELVELAQELVIGVLEAFIAIILTFMVAAFISIDLPRFMAFFRQLVPEQWHRDYDDLLGRFDEGLSGVVRGQLIICLVNGVFTYVGLVILSIKYSVLLAVIAGILSIIPVFGAVISTIPICIIALTQGFMTAVLALGWILLIHFIEANILNPKIIGTSAEIHPVIVIFALLAGESTAGLVGAILGVPVASLVLSLFKFVRDKVWGHDQPTREVGESGGEADGTIEA